MCKKFALAGVNQVSIYSITLHEAFYAAATVVHIYCSSLREQLSVD